MSTVRQTFASGKILFAAQARDMYRQHQAAIRTVLFTGTCIGCGLLTLFFLIPWLVTAAYNGQAIPILQHAIQPDAHLLDYYQTRARLQLSRLFFICVVLQFGIAVLVFRHQTVALLQRFFNATTFPMNVAIFRIVLFVHLLSQLDVARLVWFSRLPTEFRFAPIGLSSIVPYIPLNPTIVSIISVLFGICCFLSLVGLWTRFTVPMSFIFGLYVLMITQLFGKISHTNHEVWFLAILATSRCGDALSLDALRASWKRADNGSIEALPAARVYALPLRIVWVLFGVIYFFPGFWKFWTSGFDWALSENLQFRMYAKWLELGGWDPLFRIEKIPLVYHSAGLGTMAIEMSFIVLIFFPWLRKLAVVGGLLFHVMVALFMGIFFSSLMKMYVVFFDWHGIFQRVGKWLYKERMYVVYDGNCRICRRTIASLLVFDVFGQITYVNALDEHAMRAWQINWLDETALMTDMHVAVQQKVWTGFAAYRTIARRIPLLWVFLPLFYIPPVVALGQRIYRYVADSRTCSIEQSVPSVRSSVTLQAKAPLYLTAIVGVILVAGNSFAGSMRYEQGWPFVCYPMFRWIQEPEVESLDIVALDQDNRPIQYRKDDVSGGLASDQRERLIKRVIATDDPVLKRRRLESLWNIWSESDPRLQKAVTVQFYRVVLTVIPEQQAQNPLQRELLLEMQIKS